MVPRSARDPTPREAASRQRYNGTDGAPAGVPVPKLAEAGEQAPLELAKLAEPEVWAEYWSRAGYTPPAMVKTPVRGKLMSLLSNSQVPGAKVRMLTFFPATSRLGGPLLPVMMEASTDEHGFFSANLPVPQKWPTGYPRYALGFEWQDKRIMDCAVYDNLRAGEANELGVFWAPEEPYELEVSASKPEAGLSVVATGRLDPRRWEPRRAGQVLPAFGPQPLPAAGCKLAGTWDFLKTQELPYITLLRNGEPVLTRQCTMNPDEAVRIALDTESTTLFLEATPLDEVLTKFGAEAKFEITRAPDVDGEQEVSLDVGRVSLRQAFDLLADLAELSWRIQDGGVIFENGSAESEPARLTGTPFQPLQFPNDGYLTLSGTVVDGQGQPIDGAVLSLVVDAESRVAYSDPTGWFEFHGLPDRPLTAVATHELYLLRKVDVRPGALDAQIELRFLRPKATLRVVNAITEEPVTEIWLDGEVINDVYAEHAVIDGLDTRVMTSPTGIFQFETDSWLRRLHVQSPGFQPVEYMNQTFNGEIEIRLTPGMKLERRPRDFDAAQNEGMWQKDEGDGPGLWSLDDDHWVEYSFDFGEQEARYDLLLGVTNHTYGELPLDNEYEFIVDVFVDGNKVGRLNISCDPSVQQIGRLGLGKLSGPHTVRLLWTNDRYIPGQLDANIRYQSLRLMEVP
ncbi:MAG: hypothetical protein H6841_00845 [Planctomycetes bacterium]|nr:hypothetical protein [Planctomycetota bacterium]